MLKINKVEMMGISSVSGALSYVNNQVGLGTVYCVGESVRWIGGRIIKKRAESNKMVDLGLSYIDAAWAIPIATLATYQAFARGQWLKGVFIAAAIPVKALQVHYARIWYAAQQSQENQTMIDQQSQENQTIIDQQFMEMISKKVLLKNFLQPVVIGTFCGLVLVRSLIEDKGSFWKTALLMSCLTGQVQLVTNTYAKREKVFKGLYGAWQRGTLFRV